MIQWASLKDLAPDNWQGPDEQGVGLQPARGGRPGPEAGACCYLGRARARCGGGTTSVRSRFCSGCSKEARGLGLKRILLWEGKKSHWGLLLRESPAAAVLRSPWNWEESRGAGAALGLSPQVLNLWEGVGSRYRKAQSGGPAVWPAQTAPHRRGSLRERCTPRSSPRVPEALELLRQGPDSGTQHEPWLVARTLEGPAGSWAPAAGAAPDDDAGLRELLRSTVSAAREPLGEKAHFQVPSPSSHPAFTVSLPPS